VLAVRGGAAARAASPPSSAQGIIGGVALSRWPAFAEGHDKDFVLAVTERHSREDLDRFVAALASA
jgi:hypothetical protein